jgi:hypothetical protein
MPKKLAIEYESKAAVLRLQAKHEADPVLQAQLVETAESYEAMARSFRQLDSDLTDVAAE